MVLPPGPKMTAAALWKAGLCACTWGVSSACIDTANMRTPAETDTVQRLGTLVLHNRSPPKWIAGVECYPLNVNHIATAYLYTAGRWAVCDGCHKGPDKALGGADGPHEVLLSPRFWKFLQGIPKHGPGHPAAVGFQEIFGCFRITFSHFTEHPPDRFVNQVFSIR